MGISQNPEDYRFKSVAQKTDSQGNKFWSLLGAVAVPMQVDTQKEASDADEVRDLCWEWVASGRKLVDLNHSYTDIKGAVPVEAALAEKNDPRGFTPGTFFARINVYDAQIGEKVDNGEIMGFSWAGPMDREGGIALLKHPIEGSGTTEKCDSGPFPEHDHPAAVKFDSDAKVIPTRTGVVFGHDHEMTGRTHTSRSHGHVHGELYREGA